MATLASAGLPMIQFDNRGSLVAAQSLAERLGIGISFRSPDDLSRQLRDEIGTGAVRSRVVDSRDAFTFDSHADRLIAFFRRLTDRRPSSVVPAMRAFGGARRRRDTKLQGTSPGGGG